MQLRVISRYRNGEVDYEKGLLLHLKEEEGEFLLRDSPGSFVVEVAEAPKRKGARTEAAPELDVEAATVEELKAYAEDNGIELEDGASDEDIRAAIALALEERAKAKLETEPAAGTTTNVRPQRKSKTR